MLANYTKIKKMFFMPHVEGVLQRLHLQIFLYTTFSSNTIMLKVKICSYLA